MDHDKMWPGGVVRSDARLIGWLGPWPSKRDLACWTTGDVLTAHPPTTFVVEGVLGA